MTLELVDLAANVGFPIAVTVMMFRLYRQERENRRDERKAWRHALEEQTKVLRDVRREVRTDGGGDDGGSHADGGNRSS